MILRMKQKWHLLWMKYHRLLLNSCLCEKEREKIKSKIDYHGLKLN